MIMNITLPYIKSLGKEKSEENLSLLIDLYKSSNISLELKREIVSSIGRQKNKEKVADFIEQNFKNTSNSMDIVYQLYRTCLYNIQIEHFAALAKSIEDFYKNEIIYKMKDFYLFKKSQNKFKQTCSDIIEPTLLVGDCSLSLQNVKEKSVKLIFTSPPYYNAKEYSVYKSYSDYLSKMKNVLEQCHKVLEDGRFIIINVSPVITKRPGREFESIRYPIHFDFHKILSDVGFEFIDEIIWLKPEYSVPNRNGGYTQTQKPLSYKPNCVTESVMVYRKKAPFLLDENIKAYKDFTPIFTKTFDTTNCWLISPRASKHHPAIFPRELCEKIIHYYSFPGDLVLDPFGGSGTFGDVAKEMDRIPLLCEMHPDYIKHIVNKGYQIIEN
jgi:DNA modification methylase